MNIRASQKEISSRSKQRVVENGIPTNDLVFSAHVSGNDHVFPLILSLYVADESVIADVTYGEGVFWRNVPKNRYVVFETDLQTGTDCRDLPYDDGEIDCVVLPSLHALARRKRSHGAYRIRTTLPE